MSEIFFGSARGVVSDVMVRLGTYVWCGRGFPAHCDLESRIPPAVPVLMGDIPVCRVRSVDETHELLDWGPTVPSIEKQWTLTTGDVHNPAQVFSRVFPV